MKRFLPFICILALAVSPVLAQTEDSPEDDYEEETGYVFTLNQSGDQNIRISLAVVLPLNFSDSFWDLFKSGAHQMSIGGTGTLGYHYFITSRLSVGADVGFGSAVTIGSNIFNYVPVVATVTYQPCIGKFEIPLTLGVGFAWETYANKNYFPGLVVKPEAGLHYRLTPSWSLGGDLSYVFMPQFMSLYQEGAENFLGQFLNISLVARYYF